MSKLLFIILTLTFVGCSCNPTPPDPFKESEAISCEDVKGKCEETGRVCDDRVGTAVCHCDGDTVWGINEQKCIIPETKGYDSKPFYQIENVHLFSMYAESIVDLLPNRSIITVVDLDKHKKEFFIEYKRGVDDPILKSSLTDKYYFIDVDYTPFYPQDSGVGGLVEIDPKTGKFNKLFSSDNGELYDITKDGELIMAPGNGLPCIEKTLFNDREWTGYQGWIYNPKTNEHRSFCLHGHIRLLQVNENGNIYVGAENAFQHDGAVYEIDTKTLKTRVIKVFKTYQNFITFNEMDKLYMQNLDLPNNLEGSSVFVINPKTGEEKYLTELYEIMGKEFLWTQFKNDPEYYHWGLTRGYKIDDWLYFNIFSTYSTLYDELHYLMKCNLVTLECKAIQDGITTFQMSYDKKNNGLLYGFRTKSLMLDLETDIKYVLYSGEERRKGDGIDLCGSTLTNEACNGGVCTAGDDRDYGWHCECKEEDKWIDGYKNDKRKEACLPSCTSYLDCKNKAYYQCNIEKGFCDLKCQGEGSCPNGQICNSNGDCRYP